MRVDQLIEPRVDLVVGLEQKYIAHEFALLAGVEAQMGLARRIQLAHALRDGAFEDLPTFIFVLEPARNFHVQLEALFAEGIRKGGVADPLEEFAVRGRDGRFVGHAETVMLPGRNCPVA